MNTDLAMNSYPTKSNKISKRLVADIFRKSNQPLQNSGWKHIKPKYHRRDGSADDQE